MRNSLFVASDLVTQYVNPEEYKHDPLYISTHSPQGTLRGRTAVARHSDSQSTGFEASTAVSRPEPSLSSTTQPKKVLPMFL